MRRKDVTSPGGDRISRWAAVFDSAGEFLRDQEKQRQEVANTEISLVLFNDSAETVFDRIPLAVAREGLPAVRDDNMPRGGTFFAAGLKQVREIANAWKGGVLVLFLSDGRPGDMSPPSPKQEWTEDSHLQRKYRSHGESYESCAVHLQGLRDDHGDELSLHFVGIHTEGFPWLRTLATCYRGSFHETTMDLEDNVRAEAGQGAPPP